MHEVTRGVRDSSHASLTEERTRVCGLCPSPGPMPSPSAPWGLDTLSTGRGQEARSRQALAGWEQGQEVPHSLACSVLPRPRSAPLGAAARVTEGRAHAGSSCWPGWGGPACPRQGGPEPAPGSLVINSRAKLHPDLGAGLALASEEEGRSVSWWEPE